MDVLTANGEDDEPEEEEDLHQGGWVPSGGFGMDTKHSARHRLEGIWGPKIRWYVVENTMVIVGLKGSTKDRVVGTHPPLPNSLNGSWMGGDPDYLLGWSSK